MWAHLLIKLLPEGRMPSGGDSARIDARSPDGLTRCCRPVASGDGVPRAGGVSSSMPCREVAVTGQRIAESSQPRRTGHGSSRELAWQLIGGGSPPVARLSGQPRGQTSQGQRAARQSRTGAGGEGTHPQGGGRMKVEGEGVSVKGSVFGCRCQLEGLRSQVGAASFTARRSPCTRRAWARRR